MRIALLFSGTAIALLAACETTTTTGNYGPAEVSLSGQTTQAAPVQQQQSPRQGNYGFDDGRTNMGGSADPEPTSPDPDPEPTTPDPEPEPPTPDPEPEPDPDPPPPDGGDDDDGGWTES